MFMLNRSYCFLSLVFILLIGTSNFLFAQKETNVWYFGYNAGLDFNASPPSILTDGAMTAVEGCATICDSLGNLLFYTDGIKVWTSNHDTMPNGFALNGGWSSTQAAMIVPVPQHQDLFYIFTTDQEGDMRGLNYSVVDMSLNNNFGDVVKKNVLLFAPSAEKITSVLHKNGQEVWIIAHEIDTNVFRSYLLTADSLLEISRTAVGFRHTSAEGSRGCMKISPDGSKLAVVVWEQDAIQLFDFEDESGTISNPITLRYLQWALVQGLYINIIWCGMIPSV